MKICFLSQEYPLETGGGGIGTQTYLKAHGLQQRGHEIHVVSITYGDEAAETTDKGVIVHRIAAPPLPVLGYEMASTWLNYSAAVARKLTVLYKDIAFDILHVAEYGAEGFVYQADSFAHHRARFVIQMHGPLAMFVEQTGWPTPGTPTQQVCCFMEQQVLHWADARMASSAFTAAFCGRRYGFDASDVAVIHSAVDTDRFHPIASEASDGFPRILFVGNVSEAKGAGLLVQAVGRLRQRFPKIQLRVLGKVSKGYQPVLQRLVTESGAGPHIDFRGYVPYGEIPQHYAWCDVYAGPSFCEGGPGNVYLEAMACGRPVIACQTGGVSEVVRDRETGWLVAPREVDPIVEAIAALSDDEALRQRIGRQAHQWILDRFTIGKYIDRVEAIYQKVVASR